MKIWAYVEIMRDGKWVGMARVRCEVSANEQAQQFADAGWTSRVRVVRRGR